MAPHSPQPGCGSSAGPSPSPPGAPQSFPRGTAWGWGHPTGSSARTGHPAPPFCSLPSSGHTSQGGLPPIQVPLALSSCVRAPPELGQGSPSVSGPGPRRTWPAGLAPRSVRWDPGGRSPPSFREGKTRCKGCTETPGLAVSSGERCSQTLGQGGWGSPASHTYLRVSLRAARSRGSSTSALWGFSEIATLARRVS